MKARAFLVLVATFGCVIGSSRLPAEPSPLGTTAPLFFSRGQRVTHPYLPLSALEQDILEGKDGSQVLRVVRLLRPDIRKSFRLAGQSVEAVATQSRLYADGKLASVTTEYFAQAGDGTVCCLGKSVDHFANREVAGHAGSWSLIEGAQTPRLVMPSKPLPGQRLTAGDAAKPAPSEDQVAALAEKVMTPAGTFANCVKIKTIVSGGSEGYRYYAQGVGCVKEVWEAGELLLTSSPTLTAFKALAEARRADPKAADPLARLALRTVGADPRAEQYWIRAINNPGLSDHERSNLIEDLNEDGLSDPKRPSERDLPLILSRIRLIEALAPLAMDQTNADAFQEAYKDLTKMVRTLTGQAGPR